MAATILDGDALAAAWRRDIAEDVSRLRARDIVPTMASILVGDDEASATYVGRKHADCVEVGIQARDIRLPSSVPMAQLTDQVRALNLDPAIQGLLVQLPLPDHLDDAALVQAIDPGKDIDGLHPFNLGRLMQGEPGLRPCTPQAIIGLLNTYGVALAGAKVAVIGRGPLVGRPLAVMLAAAQVNATVTILHSGSEDIAGVVRGSDVVISAAGRPGLVTAEMVKPGAAVVGVGITYQDGAMVSDIAEDVSDVAAFVTPRHGSIGPLTRAMLLRNLLQAAGG